MKRKSFTIILLVLFIGVIPTVSAKETMAEKLRLVIPKVRFKDKDLNFAAQFLKRMSKDLSADGIGLNVIILVKENKGDKAKLITLDADDMSVAELIQVICAQHGLDYTVEKNAVLIGNDARIVTLVTKFYAMPSSLVGIVAKNGKADFTAFFTSMGIKFPPGAKVTHVTRASRLVVTNTASEHAKIAEIFKHLGVSQRK